MGKDEVECHDDAFKDQREQQSLKETAFSHQLINESFDRMSGFSFRYCYRFKKQNPFKLLW
jgi:hypothetical protein